MEKNLNKDYMKSMKQAAPSMDCWLREAKTADDAKKCGMYLFHNGVVRQTAKATVREGATNLPKVTGMAFSYDRTKVDEALKRVNQMEGISYVRVWLNEGMLEVGDDLMLVLVGGDIRPHVIDALQSLVDELKKKCVKEKEIY